MQMEFLKQLDAFRPECEQEEKDLALLRRCLATEQGLFTRDNPVIHMTASAWVLNPARDKVLLCYHKLYDSWAWLGGHADGETDLLQTALREVREESGLTRVRALSEEIFSIESLTVDGHVKRGQYVSSHLHLNATYLLEADDTEPLVVKPDENAGLKWFLLEDALSAPREKWMVERVYSKLNRKIEGFLRE